MTSKPTPTVPVAQTGANNVSEPSLDTVAIRGRAEAAEPGPWFSEGGDIATDAVMIALMPQDGTGRIDDDTAVFIAHARTDVPALCDEVERLWAGDSLSRSLIEALAGDRCDPDEWLGGGTAFQFWRYEAKRCLAGLPKATSTGTVAGTGAEPKASELEQAQARVSLLEGVVRRILQYESDAPGELLDRAATLVGGLEPALSEATLVDELGSRPQDVVAPVCASAGGSAAPSEDR